MNVKILEVHDFSFEANHIVEATIMRSSVKDGIPCFDKAYAYAVQDENPYEKSENEVKYCISESSASEQYELYVLLDEMRGEMETGCKDYGDEYSDLLLDIDQTESRLNDLIDELTDHQSGEIPDSVADVMTSILKINKNYEKKIIGDF